MRAPYAIGVGLLVLSGSLVIGCRDTPVMSPDLQAVLSHDASPVRGVSSDVWADTRKFYAARGHALAWVDRDGPSTTTAKVIAALQAAEAHGLDPSDYATIELSKAKDNLTNAADEDSAQARRLAEFDVEATAMLLQLGRHVATGRLSPTVIDARWNAQRTPPDYVAMLLAAHAKGVETFLRDVQPRHPEYEGWSGDSCGINN